MTSKMRRYICRGQQIDIIGTENERQVKNEINHSIFYTGRAGRSGVLKHDPIALYLCNHFVDAADLASFYPFANVWASPCCVSLF